MLLQTLQDRALNQKPFGGGPELQDKLNKAVSYGLRSKMIEANSEENTEERKEFWKDITRYFGGDCYHHNTYGGISFQIYPLTTNPELANHQVFIIGKRTIKVKTNSSDSRENNIIHIPLTGLILLDTRHGTIFERVSWCGDTVYIPVSPNLESYLSLRNVGPVYWEAEVENIVYNLLFKHKTV